jgi:carboxyl-terminal processing protease
MQVQLLSFKRSERNMSLIDRNSLMQTFRRKFFRRVSSAILVLLAVTAVVFCLGSASGNIPSQDNNDDAWRAKIISNLIRSKFSSQHYSHRSIDDSLSEAAFTLYVKQLDFQKRFLLQEDVAHLKKYADKIDDEINTGNIELPVVAAKIMNNRVRDVKKIVNEILDKKFDLNKEETLETDPEKRNYVSNEKELYDLWRKMLKYEVANRFLSYEELEKIETPSEKATENNSPEKGVNLPKKDKAKEDPLAKAIDKVRNNYNEIFDRMLSLKDKEQYDRYFDSFTRAFDPHSSYLPPTQREDFDIHMKGSLEGIGARLQEVDGVIKVVAVIPGGAASRQGDLNAEDIILKVGEGDEEPVDIVGMRIRDAVGLIRGKKGTTVKLTVKKSDGRVKLIAIVRDVVNIEETFVKHAVLQTEKDKKIGYILIPTFYRDFSEGKHGDEGRNATEDVRLALLDLNKQNIDGLVLDLRNNGGGALIDAVDIAGLFINKGPIVQIKEDNGNIRLDEDDDPSVYYSGPMIVLVNQLSASASEILAGALQDYGRALIVGSQHTHGKGTVQAFIDLDSSLFWPNMQKYKPLGALKVTIQKFYRITGQSTQAKGVIPDIILPDRMEFMKYGEKYIDYALPWDTISPTIYSPAGSFSKRLDYLRRQSEQRVKGNEKFKEIMEEIEKAKKRRENTVRYLSLASVKKERDELKRDEGEDLLPGHDDFDLENEQSSADKKTTEKDLQKKWLEEVSKDPYVAEAENIFVDLQVGVGLLKASNDR